jgi:hypothetical protein
MLETGVGDKLSQKILRKALRRGYLGAIIMNNFFRCLGLIPRSGVFNAVIGFPTIKKE